MLWPWLAALAGGGFVALRRANKNVPGSPGRYGDKLGASVTVTNQTTGEKVSYYGALLPAGLEGADLSQLQGLAASRPITEADLVGLTPAQLQAARNLGYVLPGDPPPDLNPPPPANYVSWEAYANRTKSTPLDPGTMGVASAPTQTVAPPIPPGFLPQEPIATLAAAPSELLSDTAPKTNTTLGAFSPAPLPKLGVL